MEATGERYIPEKMLGDITIEHMHRYNSILDIVKDRVVLDAACGTGYGTNLIGKYAQKAYGIDISKEAIEYAKENYSRENIDFRNMSIAVIDFPDKFFDVIVSFETIEHVDEEIQKKFMGEISRVLKKDGILIMSTPNKYNYSDIRNYKNEYHVKEFYESEFRDLICDKLKNINLYYQYFNNSSYIISYDEENLKYLNFDIENKGMYFLIVASNNEIKSTDTINSVYYYPSEDNLDIIRCVETYEDVIKRKDEEFKKSVEIYEDVIKQKDEEFKKSVETYEDVIKQKDEEFKKSVETYEDVVRQKDEEFKQSVDKYESMIRQKDEEFKKSVEIYDAFIKQKDQEFNEIRER